ncbi:MAG: DUF1553 domain-containing protein [Verrucomicrobia bacterium]|nr:DUF1553 domain-containing protein [Verrucomicrobiota bacterium]
MKSLFVLGLCVVAVTARCGDDRLLLVPKESRLTGPASRQTLLVEQVRGHQLIRQLTNGVSYNSSDESVVKILNGVALPVANGKATITAAVGKKTAKAEVTVESFDQPVEVSFRNQVQPVLAKSGCSSGACHGAAAGQNGFKLSLRGYDDEGDWRALTHGALGRRIIPSDPGRSLMLLKPTGAVPHKGGKRFEVDSIDYKILSEWIAAGTPGPKADEPRIERIEFLPDHVVLQPGASQQLLARAHFSDGHTEDVTHWAKYTAANASVTTVDDNGLVQVVGFGEGPITAWYLSKIAIATVTVPYTNNVPAAVFAKAKRRNFIDDLVLEKLRELNLPPSPRCTDEEFLRRAFLDTIGVLPTAEEVRAFLADRSPGKRDELIESLLKRPEFVDYWSYKWADLLLVNSDRLARPAMFAFNNWIRHQVAANTPWDRFVRELVTARGSTLENGGGNFYVLHDEPTAMAETTTQAFLGMSVGCAKCHNHPMEKWTNDEYFGFANLFARVRAKNGAADGEKLIFAANAGDLVQPRTGRPQPPRPLDGPPLPLDSAEDRRETLAHWLTSRENPYFARSIVNRVWKNFYGVGVIEAVDDLRVTNPASNEKLLSAAARSLADQGFDLKGLMRTILQSETYQRSSAPLPGNAADTRFYARYYPRRLMAEVLLDAVSQVTEVPTEFITDLRNQNRGLGDKYPLGLRALQLPDSLIFSYFLKSFGRADRNKTCDCERTSEPSIAQALHIANGDTINQKLSAKNNRITKLLAAKLPTEKLVEEVYLAALSRFPSAAEKAALVKAVGEAKEEERRAVVEDLCWALLSSKEFLFNH